MKTFRRILVCCLPFMVVVLAYLAGGVYYSDFFLPNTYINGYNVGGMKVMEVENKLQADSINNSIVITRNDDSTEEIRFSDIGYSCQYQTDLNEIKNSQNSLFWAVAFLKDEEYTVPVVTTYDETKLDQQIEQLKCITNETIQDPVDARIEKTDTGFIVVDAIDGNRLNLEKVKEVVKTSLNKGITQVNLAEENCYYTASIRADDPSITEVMDAIGKFNDLVININMVDAIETVDYSVFSNWLIVDGTTVSLDEEAMKPYMENLHAKYSDYQVPQTFMTSNGAQILVGGSQYDTYGFDLQRYNFEDGRPGTLTTLKNAILSGESQTIDAVWNIPAKHRGENNIGNTYIEIDLTTQHMWYYIDGELYIDTPIISGLPTASRETPTGLYRVWHKERDAVLVGADYRTPVTFWMPITWTGIGIHDANWQSNFGGNTYQYSGSHGCINTPYNAAKTIFERVEYDTPVIVYKS